MLAVVLVLGVFLAGCLVGYITASLIAGQREATLWDGIRAANERVLRMQSHLAKAGIGTAAMRGDFRRPQGVPKGVA